MTFCRPLLALLLLCITACAGEAESRTSATEQKAFEQWLQGVRQEALAQGISQETVSTALTGLTVQQKVLKLDRKQPEKTIRFPEYRTRIVSEKRVSEGRQLLREHRALLERISDRYGVEPRFIVALWGIETSYGAITGNSNVVEALATLAFEGRRAAFFRKELLGALTILDQDHSPKAAMTGSWAGAMGQCQFMPSTFLRYAVDDDGNGVRDIWHSEADVFASIAHYLSGIGWQRGIGWGTPVELPEHFNRALLGRDTKKSTSAWQKLGVSGVETLRGDISIVIPDGSDTAYAVTRNYDVIMQWNRSLYFATSVGLLADALEE